jgi:hypothetical protein
LSSQDAATRRRARNALRLTRRGAALGDLDLRRLAVSDLRRRFVAAGLAAGWIASVEGFLSPWESLEFDVL